jgi:transcriptional regulator with XRE-family HTH domain
MRCLSQRELAKRASVSAQAISEYERDQDVPSSGVIICLSRPWKLESSSLCAPQLETYLEIESILSTVKYEFKFNYPEGFPRLISSMVEILLRARSTSLEPYAMESLGMSSKINVQPNADLSV